MPPFDFEDMLIRHVVVASKCEPGPAPWFSGCRWHGHADGDGALSSAFRASARLYKSSSCEVPSQPEVLLAKVHPPSNRSGLVRSDAGHRDGVAVG